MIFLELGKRGAGLCQQSVTSGSSGQPLRAINSYSPDQEQVQHSSNVYLGLPGQPSSKEEYPDGGRLVVKSQSWGVSVSPELGAKGTLIGVPEPWQASILQHCFMSTLRCFLAVWPGLPRVTA